MAYASKAGRAQTSARNPRAFAVCDRCGIWHNHDQLQWQMQWAGAMLYNTRLLVCRRCLDVPQEQLRTITLPPDPVPVMNARVEPFLQDSTDYRVTSGHDETYRWTGIPVPGTEDFLVTSPDETGSRVTQQTGFANGSLNDLPGTDPNAPGDDDPGLPRNTDEVPIAGLYPWIPYPAPDGFHWEFTYLGDEIVTLLGLPVMILLEDTP